MIIEPNIQHFFEWSESLINLEMCYFGSYAACNLQSN